MPNSSSATGMPTGRFTMAAGCCRSVRAGAGAAASTLTSGATTTAESLHFSCCACPSASSSLPSQSSWNSAPAYAMLSITSAARRQPPRIRISHPWRPAFSRKRCSSSTREMRQPRRRSPPSRSSSLWKTRPKPCLRTDSAISYWSQKSGRQTRGRPAAMPSFTEDCPPCVRKTRTAGWASTARCRTNGSTRTRSPSRFRPESASSGCCACGRLQRMRQPSPRPLKASRSVPTAVAVRKPLASVPKAT
mmetsp:Transcript_32953/g.102769  ORF Transcript_32953/g.102769 Transcript_32953/m.102769 type:complete len:248 (-) Transcript_32953:909-1652(-)